MRRRLIEQDFRRRFVCFTFDDGYRDNLQYALPILKKYDAPFALYIPTSFPDRPGELWWLDAGGGDRAPQPRRARDGRRGSPLRLRQYGSQIRALRAHLLVAAQPRERRRFARAPCAIWRSVRGRQRGVLQRPVHDLERDRRDRRRSARDDRGAHRQSRHAEEGERRGGAQRDADERARRSRPRSASGPRISAIRSATALRRGRASFASRRNSASRPR